MRSEERWKRKGQVDAKGSHESGREVPMLTPLQKAIETSTIFDVKRQFIFPFMNLHIERSSQRITILGRKARFQENE